MPNKTIYVSDDDLPLHGRAQQLAGGSLSAAISQALREFVKRGEARMDGLEEITVAVGAPGMRTRKRFTGRRLVRWSHRTGQGRVETFSVYRTARDRYAVHLRRDPDWARSAGAEAWDSQWADRDWEDPANWYGPSSTARAGTTADATPWWEPGAYDFAVHDTLDGLRAQVPPELAELVTQQAGVPAVEDLDI